MGASRVLKNGAGGVPERRMGDMKRLLKGARIDPPPVTAKTTLTEVVG